MIFVLNISPYNFNSSAYKTKFANLNTSVVCRMGLFCLNMTFCGYNKDKQYLCKLRVTSKTWWTKFLVFNRYDIQKT